MLTDEEASAALAEVDGRYRRMRIRAECRLERRGGKTLIIARARLPGHSKGEATLLEWDAEHLEAGPTAYRIRTDHG